MPRSMLAVSTVFTLFLTPLLSAAAPGTDGALETQVASLAQRVAQLEERLEGLTRQLQAQHPDPGTEKEASEALQGVQALAAQGRLVEARDAMDDFMSSYASTEAARRAQSLRRELAVIGTAAPDSWKIDRWFQGETEVDLEGPAPTILVFWETWCPHCRREVPKLEATYEHYRDRGLQVVGLSRFSRGTTEEALRSFAAENHITFPLAREDGVLSAHFGVSGIPAVAVLKDRQVVWRGHPARLTPAVLEGILAPR